MAGDVIVDGRDPGFLRLGRGFFDSFLWAERRAYSKAEAWLDIVAQCPYKPQKRLVAGELVEVPRGGFVASERYFSGRWMWSRTKVRSFLALLEQEKMILKKPQKDHRNTTFLLCNYDKYNPPKDHEPDHWKTSERPPRDQIEEDIDGKNYAPTPRARGGGSWSLPEVEAAGQLNGVPAEVCKAYHDDREAGGWLDAKHRPIASMPHDLATFWRHWQSREAERTAKSRGKGAGPAPSKWDNEF